MLEKSLLFAYKGDELDLYLHSSFLKEKELAKGW